MAGFIRRWWKLPVGILIGIALGAGGEFLYSIRYAVKSAQTFEIASDLPSNELENALYQATGVELRAGHTVEVVYNGAVIDRVIAEITRATRSIDVVMYIWEAGVASTRVTAALVARAKAGVVCRILIDDLGSPDFTRDVKPALADAGCSVYTFRPGSGIDVAARNHRKIFVFDDQLVITGGLGIRDDWMGDGVHGMGWRDTGVVLTGPAVRDAQQAFAENWQEAGGSLLPASELARPEPTGPTVAAFVSSTGSPVLTTAERLIQLVIAVAHRRLWITNAYLAPSPAILELLRKKAAAGVDVRLLVPGDKSDVQVALRAGRQLYGKLRAAGVKIWEYQPVMIHAKTMVVDDDIAVIGSINLDPLSLNKLEEDAVLVRDSATATELARA
ncbi:MAG: phosphatidylserine/phosphatidylglycerophosphate/cardiolipin synthase family protein, partial [Kofleriaceae bacterium]